MSRTSWSKIIMQGNAVIDRRTNRSREVGSTCRMNCDLIKMVKWTNADRFWMLTKFTHNVMQHHAFYRARQSTLVLNKRRRCHLSLWSNNGGGLERQTPSKTVNNDVVKRTRSSTATVSPGCLLGFQWLSGNSYRSSLMTGTVARNEN